MEHNMGTPTAVVVGVGAAQGIGAAVCRRFAAGGYHVLVAGRTESKIEQVAERIRAAGGSAQGIVVDATLEADVVQLFDVAMAPMTIFIKIGCGNISLNWISY